ncbi:alpha-glucan water dikinase [Klebsormidium nitens]|uniref:Alpha-glucan water dikinase n=1 Tax=Klebsormidium nitens TaxID=105231 RepID=A0A1Y1INT8_KLENI|nr:alpha-glucan water dikinase [Klebsormidium nitens]|eukprot:GAQ91752.1 alpha-glucan water dikinase [Klebsormidium nitens]
MDGLTAIAKSGGALTSLQALVRHPCNSSSQPLQPSFLGSGCGSLPAAALTTPGRACGACLAGASLPSCTLLSSCSSSITGLQLPQAAPVRRRALAAPPRSGVTRAAAAVTQEVEEMSRQFALDNESDLRVRIVGEEGSTWKRCELRVSGRLAGVPLVLHWAITKPGRPTWYLPAEAQRPANTREYKKRALQTTFNKIDDGAILIIDVDAAQNDAIEFTLKDDSCNAWFKNRGSNFRVEVGKGGAAAPPAASPAPAAVDIPKELVDIQSYLRWERAGKQTYSYEQQEAEYRAAREELEAQVRSGATLEELRQRLKGGPATNGAASGNGAGASQGAGGVAVPEDLVGIQAYLRWERGGKKNYSPEEQQREYEAARAELQAAVAGGASVASLRAQLQAPKKEAQAAAAQKPQSRVHIERKQWDPAQLINAHTATAHSPGTAPPAPAPKEPTPLELAADVVMGADGATVVSRQVIPVDGGAVLVLVTEEGGEVTVHVATDLREPLALHWAVSRKGQEWGKPPSSVVPEGSAEVGGSVETPLARGWGGQDSVQAAHVALGRDAGGFAALPFVLHAAAGWWLKNGGKDFVAPLKKAPPPPPAADVDASKMAKWLVDEIADCEREAEKSFMHRFNLAAGFAEKARDAGSLGLAAVFVWLRYCQTRQLNWNVNYNVKPREISAAQNRLTDVLEGLYATLPGERELVRLALSAIGRGGEGDVGQRIRDEILVVQQNNNAKGGMLEEWHQKLHNNTSPDDVVICQALLDYLAADLDLGAYWARLEAEGVSRERLASYDRPIVSEPRLKPEQKEGLIRDLGAYLKTLKAVHSGADLESAAAAVLGYKLDAMRGGQHGDIHVEPVPGLAPELPDLLDFVLEHINDAEPLPLLLGLVEARRELRPALQAGGDRLKDCVYLDLALDSAVRTTVERSLAAVAAAPAADQMGLAALVVENLCLSLDDNEELVFCLKAWMAAAPACRANEPHWALRAKAVMDRTRLALADIAERTAALLQPTATYMGHRLGVASWAVDIFSEEVIRMGSAAALSQLLARLDPVLRAAADLGAWQVISPVAVAGVVRCVDSLGDVQDVVYDEATILVAGHVSGEEEIPDGAVAVLTPDMPDVLSHVSVRARNGKICFATCFDEGVLAELRALDGRALRLEPAAEDLKYTPIEAAEVQHSAAGGGADDDVPSGLSITKKAWAGKYAIPADDFTPDLVGAKSRNLADLRGRLPDWIHLPTSVAIPFGTFDQVLAAPQNRAVAAEVKALQAALKAGQHEKLAELRSAVLELAAPEALVTELRAAFQGAGLPWPGEQGEERWEAAWRAIKKVWASKWNERAFFSCRKARINHDDLSMAVLCQQVIRADYAYVIHTTNPSTGDASEIYAEVVRGLGETLVGAYPGRALSFAASKSDLAPRVLGFPSKRVGLFCPDTLIFRSDSNGEDLEGYAGAGLYDSITMDPEQEEKVDYSVDKLLNDTSFQKDVLTRIAQLGDAVEKALKSPQDIEGVVKDGKLYMVQTRPQM